MGEVENIKARFQKRKTDKRVIQDSNSQFLYWMNCEQERRYRKILNKRFKDLSKINMLEIGAGGGDNLSVFYKMGIPWKNIWANELLADRGVLLKRNLHPDSHIEICNALDLSYKNQFDIVFQSTVFTSILDENFKMNLAEKLVEMAKSNGIILWYDFIYDNPRNKDVKGISKWEIKRLFPDKKIKYYNVTLAPPIGRRVGKFYNYFNNLFPFLRTHVIAVINK